MSRVDICVCTYQRPHLSDTLASLGHLQVPEGITASVLVIDNDRTPSAQGVVESIDLPIPLRYVHCPHANISIARNGALDHSDADCLAFIDDDELASPEWLAALLETQRRHRVDAVLGPVQAIYDETAPRWMRLADVHSTRPVWVRDKIRTGYTCNVLINRRSAALEGLRFDLTLGQTGGEDTTFFAEMVRRGGSIAFAEDALVLEPVPTGRATFGWLLRRRFRMGQTHGRLPGQADTPARKLRLVGLGAAKVVYCAGTALLHAFAPARRNAALMRLALHAGKISAVTGLGLLPLYRPDPVVDGLKGGR